MAAVTDEFAMSLKAVNNFIGEHPSRVTLNGLKALSESIKFAPEQTRTVIDLALRERVLSLLSGGEECMEEVRALLALSANAAIEEICSASTPFLLFADFVNTRSISDVEANFPFLERTIGKLKNASLFGYGRNILLRMCNDLLRRLSKSQNTVFCGRIQLFLTSLFPLNEKSGLNFTSNFNLEKEVTYNSDPDEKKFNAFVVEEEDFEANRKTSTSNTGVASSLINANLYRSFWHLQVFLKSPTQCYTRDGWKSFVECVDTVVSTFQSIRLSVPACETRWQRFSMYLTSEKLLDLQLMDRNFRRYILTQLLIIFQYLTAQVKFKNESQRLDETQTRWVETQEAAIAALMRRDANTSRLDMSSSSSTLHSSSTTVASTPHEDVTEAVVQHVLSREVHWNDWKNQACPSFIREPEKPVLTPRKRRVNPLQDRSGRKLFRFGNSELDELWSKCPDNLEACRNKERLFNPSDLGEYFETAILELDPREKVEEQYKSINREEWSWRAIRILSRRCGQFYTNWNPPGRPLKEYLTNILTEKIQRPGAVETKTNGETPRKEQRSNSKGAAQSAPPAPSACPADAAAATHAPDDPLRVGEVDERRNNKTPSPPFVNSNDNSPLSLNHVTAPNNQRGNCDPNEDGDSASFDDIKVTDDVEDTDGEAVDDDDDMDTEYTRPETKESAH